MFFLYIFFNPPDSRHLISKFVCLFGSCTSAPTVRFKEAWEENLGVELSDDTWDRCLATIHACSINSRHQLIQFKVIYRLHYTKDKLHKIYPSVSPMCDRCKVAEDTASHAFWFC